MYRLILAFVIALAACATNKTAELPAVTDARADGTFLFLTASAAETASDASLRHAMATMCDPACDRIYVDLGAAPSADVLLRIVDAASTVRPKPRVFLMPTSKKAIELDTADVACPVTVAVQDDGASVWRAGNPIEPDPACGTWNKSICRGEDARYDWPRLRSEVGFVDAVCVGFETASAEQLPSIHETLRQPMIRLVTPPATASVSRADQALAERVLAAESDLQWCLDGELAEPDQVPMSATLRVGVHADGSVTRVEVVDGLRTTSNFEECIAAVAEKFVFEPRDAATVSDVRLAFEPGGAGPTIEDVTAPQ